MAPSSQRTNVEAWSPEQAFLDFVVGDRVPFLGLLAPLPPLAFLGNTLR